MINRLCTAVVTLLLGTLLPFSAGLAQNESESDSRWILKGALDLGIDETVDSGGDTYRIGTTQTVGVGYEFTEGLWTTRISLSYESGDGDANGTDNTFTVWPLEVLFLRALAGGLHVGLGFGYHAEPEYEAESDTADLALELDTAYALNAVAEFAAIRNFSIGGRYTFVRYSRQDVSFVFDDGSSSDYLDGQSLGVYAVAKF